MMLRHIRSKAGVTTLETMDASERRAVPTRGVKRMDGDRAEVADADWHRGAALDIELADVTLPAADIKRQLHARGLWTKADLLANSVQARLAMGDALLTALVDAIQ